MSKLILICCTSIFLVGCSTTVPVQVPKFPVPPELLMRPAPELTKIEPSTKVP